MAGDGGEWKNEVEPLFNGEAPRLIEKIGMRPREILYKEPAAQQQRRERVHRQAADGGDGDECQKIVGHRAEPAPTPELQHGAGVKAGAVEQFEHYATDEKAAQDEENRHAIGEDGERVEFVWHMALDKRVTVKVDDVDDRSGAQEIEAEDPLVEVEWEQRFHRRSGAGAAAERGKPGHGVDFSCGNNCGQGRKGKSQHSRPRCAHRTKSIQ